MRSGLLHKIVSFINDTTGKEILRQVRDGDDPHEVYRGSLIWALVDAEIKLGTSKAEVLRLVDRMYEVCSSSPDRPSATMKAVRPTPN